MRSSWLEDPSAKVKVRRKMHSAAQLWDVHLVLQ